MKKLLLLLCFAPLCAFGQNANDGGRLPTQGTEIGAKGADGLFHFVSVDNTGKINIVTTPGTLGQQNMANSAPVVIASDQTAVPISAASLPLPAGASTSALQTTGNTSLATVATNTGNIPAKGQATMVNSGPVVIASDQSNVPVAVKTAVGPANFTNAQVTTSTTAATLAAARATRRSVLVKNIDATITIYIGAATVTAANGVPLKPGESVVLNTTGLIQAIAASGTPVVAYFEEYD